jgi:hypothetical protein
VQRYNQESNGKVTEAEEVLSGREGRHQAPRVVVSWGRLGPVPPSWSMPDPCRHCGRRAGAGWWVILEQLRQIDARPYGEAARRCPFCQRCSGTMRVLSGPRQRLTAAGVATIS